MRWLWAVIACTSCVSNGAGDVDVDVDGDGDGDVDLDAGVDADTDTDTDSASDSQSASESPSTDDPPTCSESCDACSSCLDPLFEERGGCAVPIKLCAIDHECRALLCCWTGCGGSCDAEYCADPTCGDPMAACGDACREAFCGVGQCLSDACGWPYCEEQCPPPAASACEACVECRGTCE